MTARKGLVLDANILIRATFGNKTRKLLEVYEGAADFFIPEACFIEAEEYIPNVAGRMGFPAEAALGVLQGLARIVSVVDASLYESFKEQAHRRVAARDAKDWPVVAVAMMLELPIWTEDRDLFGSGMATWTTDRVELFLKEED